MAAGDSPRRPLWRDRDFSVFWAAQTLSVAGDSFAYIAVPLLVLHATGSVARMGLLTGAGGAASVGAGAFAGVLADRLDRRTLLICCDLARMVLYGIIPVAWSLRQQVTPDHLLGRVTSAFWTVHFSLGPVGAAVLAWAADRFSVGRCAPRPAPAAC